MPSGVPVAARGELFGIMHRHGSPYHHRFQRATRSNSNNILRSSSSSDGFNASNASSILSSGIKQANDVLSIGDSLVAGIIIHFLIGAAIANPDLVTAACEYACRLVYRAACAAHGTSVATAIALADGATSVIRAVFGAVHAAAVYASTLFGSSILTASNHPRRAVAATSFVLFSLFGRRRGRGYLLQRFWRQQR